MTSDLKELALRYGCDKWGAHWYAQHYERFLNPFREKHIRLLEIGVGGYDDPTSGGASLRMWREYLPKATIAGIDVFDKRGIEIDQVRCYQGDQTDLAFLTSVVEDMGGIDVVIDDGSHLNADVIRSFECLFPLLSDHGLYFVEDVETAYWPPCGGSSTKNAEHTSVAYFKRLVEALNHQELLVPGYVPSYFDEHVFGLHFYHNMICVEKRKHAEKSLVVVNNSKLKYGDEEVAVDGDHSDD